MTKHALLPCSLVHAAPGPAACGVLLTPLALPLHALAGTVAGYSVECKDATSTGTFTCSAYDSSKRELATWSCVIAVSLRQGVASTHLAGHAQAVIPWPLLLHAGCRRASCAVH